MKRLPGLVFGPTVLFSFPLRLCQRVLKLDRGVNSSAAFLEPFPSSLVVWVGSCLVALVLTCQGFVIWSGVNGLTSRPLESCHHQCLSAVCGVLGCPGGSAAELLDGSLKLRYCAAVFTKQLPPRVLPRLGGGVGRSKVVTSSDLLDCRGNFEKRVRLTRKTRPGASSHVIPDAGHSTHEHACSYRHQYHRPDPGGPVFPCREAYREGRRQTHRCAENGQECDGHQHEHDQDCNGDELHAVRDKGKCGWWKGLRAHRTACMRTSSRSSHQRIHHGLIQSPQIHNGRGPDPVPVHQAPQRVYQRHSVNTAVWRQRSTHVGVHLPKPQRTLDSGATLGVPGRLVHLDQTTPGIGRHPNHQRRAAAQQDADLDSLLRQPRSTYFSQQSQTHVEVPESPSPHCRWQRRQPGGARWTGPPSCANSSGGIQNAYS